MSMRAGGENRTRMIMVGTHFAEPTADRIERHGSTHRLVPSATGTRQRYT